MIFLGDVSNILILFVPKAYVWKYNIYLKMNATAEPVQVTNNGKENEILNGVPDWVYEGDLFIHNIEFLSFIFCYVN